MKTITASVAVRLALGDFFFDMGSLDFDFEVIGKCYFKDVLI
jgi:hypothetical protein